MVLDHDFERFPELTNRQLEQLELSSPHVQIKEGFFSAVVVDVVDGDTIKVETDFRDFVFSVRLADIDAPELNQVGGDASRKWLEGKILNKEVLIGVDQRNRVDKYGRLIGRVYSDGLDVGLESIHLGYSIPFGSAGEGQILGFERMVEAFL